MVPTKRERVTRGGEFVETGSRLAQSLSNMVCMAAAVVGFVFTLALSTAASSDQNVQRLFDMLDTDGDGVFSTLELNEHFAGGVRLFARLKVSMESWIKQVIPNSPWKICIS